MDSEMQRKLIPAWFAAKVGAPLGTAMGCRNRLVNPGSKFRFQWENLSNSMDLNEGFSMAMLNHQRVIPNLWWHLLQVRVTVDISRSLHRRRQRKGVTLKLWQQHHDKSRRRVQNRARHTWPQLLPSVGTVGATSVSHLGRSKHLCYANCVSRAPECFTNFWPQDRFASGGHEG